MENEYSVRLLITSITIIELVYPHSHRRKRYQKFEVFWAGLLDSKLCQPAAIEVGEPQ